MKTGSKKKIADTMTIADAFKWLSLGYEINIDNGEVTSIQKRKEPHAGES